MLIKELPSAIAHALIGVATLLCIALLASGPDAYGQDEGHSDADLSLNARKALGVCSPSPQPLIPGYLDRSFGECGFIIWERELPGKAVAVQPDGKIVTFNAGVFSNGPGRPGAIHRFNADGSIDKGFGQSGQVTLKGNQHLHASGALQPDGKIVAASTYYDGELHNYLERFLPDGKPDRSFGSGGAVETLTAWQHVAIDPTDESVLVTGGAGYPKAGACSSLDSTVPDPGKSKPTSESFRLYAAVERYNKRGQPDRSFGRDGSGRYVTPYCFSSGKDIAIQPDGKIVIVGNADDALHEWSVSKVLVVRFTRKGSLDRGFGENGRVIRKFGKDELEMATGVVVQDNGGIVVVGFDGSEASDEDDRSAVVIARFTEDGTLDRSFGPEGNIIRWGIYSSADDVVLRKDGKLVVAGAGTNGAGPSSVAVAQFEANGMPDKGFGANGVSITAIEGPKSRAHAIALQPFDGKIVVAGYSDWRVKRLLLARYQGRRYEP